MPDAMCTVCEGVHRLQRLSHHLVTWSAHTRPLCWFVAGVLADAAIPGQKLPEAVVPTAAVMSFTSAATAALPPAPALASSAPAAASAAASAEAARVKELEAELAEFQFQSTLLQAQNMRLESELEKAQQLSQAGSRMASLVQPPCHWQAHAQGQTLLYVELPIFDKAKQGAMKPSDAELKAQHKGWFSDMRTNGVDMNDALIALRSASASLQCLISLLQSMVFCTAMPDQSDFIHRLMKLKAW